MYLSHFLQSAAQVLWRLHRPPPPTSLHSPWGAVHRYFILNDDDDNGDDDDDDGDDDDSDDDNIDYNDDGDD